MVRTLGPMVETRKWFRKRKEEVVGGSRDGYEED